MAALNRAVALEQAGDVPVRVGDRLDLDVARALDKLLHHHRTVAERLDRLVARSPQLALKLPFFADDPHPTTAAARAGFQHHRKADLHRGGF